MIHDFHRNLIKALRMSKKPAQPVQPTQALPSGRRTPGAWANFIANNTNRPANSAQALRNAVVAHAQNQAQQNAQPQQIAPGQWVTSAGTPWVGPGISQATFAQAQADAALIRAFYPDGAHQVRRDPVSMGLLVIVDAMRNFPDLSMPLTFGHRSWLFDASIGLLRSPIIGTPWHEAELHCERWDDRDVLRGASGIHAHLLPHDWKQQFLPEQGLQIERHGWTVPYPVVTGLVERFDRFVLGTLGWRAEWVIIRALHAPSRAMAAALRVGYPEVEISYGHR